MPKHSIREMLRERGWLLADGATGTNYFRMGLKSGTPPEIWNDEHPDRVIDLHRRFIAAGADLVLTNSFGGTANRLRLHGDGHRVREVNAKAAAHARSAADAAGRPVLVAGSMGPTGDLYQPIGDLTVEAGTAAYAEQAEGLAEGGADVLWIETISSEEELTAAVSGAARTDLPIVATMSFDTKGRTMMGISPVAFAKIAQGIGHDLVAIGANCGTGASELVCNVAAMARESGPLSVVAKGNCGLPQMSDAGEIVYSGTPELMADYARLARDSGATIIGGCCGTSPEHLAAMREALERHVPGTPPSVDEIERRLGAVSEYARKTT
ncbi:MAG: betaine--homocysteine S-methyltransferase [Rhizobiales bacterium]|nr:betaine--homocysteine S-methyltransferase [Hyphomicrobiales bacterium]